MSKHKHTLMQGEKLQLQTCGIPHDKLSPVLRTWFLKPAHLVSTGSSPLSSYATSELLNLFVPEFSYLLGRNNSAYIRSSLQWLNVLGEGLEQSMCYTNFYYYVSVMKQLQSNLNNILLDTLGQPLSTLSLLTFWIRKLFTVATVLCIIGGFTASRAYTH